MNFNSPEDPAIAAALGIPLADQGEEAARRAWQDTEAAGLSGSGNLPGRGAGKRITTPAGPRPDLAAALAAAHRLLVRHVVFPTDHAAVAATLWAGHAHQVDRFDSTPRLAFLSPEPGSGKSRALEVLGTLVPNPMHAVNATPAALFRSVSDLEGLPTILFDEIDTVFGPKAKDNEEIRGFLNAGHRKGAVAYRCVGLGTVQKVVAFPAYSAVAVAGLHNIPDTIASRSIVVRMRRRKPSEAVQPWRLRDEPAGHLVRDLLAAAMERTALPADPVLPGGVADRPADVWEPLLSVAQAAGGPWPDLAAAACLHFVEAVATEAKESLPVLLLRDLRTVFADVDALHSGDILTGLHALDESPWSNLRGAPLDARGLARMLGSYGVRSVQVFRDGRNQRGYRRADLYDPWQRYLPVGPDKSARSAMNASPSVEDGPRPSTQRPDLALSPPDLALGNGPAERESADLADLADLRPGTDSEPECPGCGEYASHPELFDGWHVGCVG
jgi:hypothetical protein